ncbi:amidase-like [Gigantopelta aegis]|uniref:amidase-like n=1 Tax=Gigantopelta aegis TaxID=1735272 RepID=UPI001B88D1BC|nr:amidase-like [Gigantopelta aegis]
MLSVHYKQMAKELYRSPAIKLPTLDEFSQISRELNLGCTNEELEAFIDDFSDTASVMQRVSELVEPQLPVKCTRTPGYRPEPKDNPYNAWYWRCDIQSGKKGKLAGKTVGIKDNIAVAGVPMMNGSKLLEGYTPEFDATVVTRILDEGGHIVGKTACEDFCCDGGSFTCSTGPIRNPHDESRSAGGSSSGSAALVSANLIDVAVGGDQGGSIRTPASYCGIVGLKPTYGLVPYTGACSIDPTIDHLGPMARTVHDCALLLEVLAGYDEGRDSRQPRDLKIPEYTSLLESGISGKRLGLLKEGFDLCSDQDVANLVMTSAKQLSDVSAVVEEISVPLHLDGDPIMCAVGLQGSSNCMLKGAGSGFSKGFYASSMQEAMTRGLQARPYDMSSTCKMMYIAGEYLNQKYGNKFYTKGHNLNLVLTKAYDEALKQYDVLILPTITCKPEKLPLEGCSTTELLQRGMKMMSNTSPFDITGHPALSINAGFIDGLPIGMMIVGRHFDETTVLQVARSFEILRDKN